jgi:phage N-6-adenine-methyltransferase
MSKIPKDFDTNEFETPPWFFNALNKEFAFQIDLAANKKNTLCPIFLGPEDDSLSKDWHKLSDGYMFLNPPYSPLQPWIEKAQLEAERGARLVMVVPMTTLNNRYFTKYLPDEIRIVVGRVNFFALGDEIKGCRHDSVVLIYRGNAWKLKGQTEMKWVNRDWLRAPGTTTEE